MHKIPSLLHEQNIETTLFQLYMIWSDKCRSYKLSRVKLTKLPF